MNETTVRYEQLSDSEQRAVDAVSWEDPGVRGSVGRPSLTRRDDGVLLAYFSGEEDEKGRELSVASGINCSFATDTQRSLTPQQEKLYLLGWRVWGDPDGFKLEFVDSFAGRKEKFGSHETAERAWEVAALLSAKPKAITSTGRP